MRRPSPGWRNTTHDWAADVDAGHLERIRGEPAAFAPTGALHLVLEVLAYAADEAGWAGSGEAAVTLHGDGSVAIADHGRGTDTRVSDQGLPVRKPVMTARDLRFFDSPGAAVLPDGHPRWGMSVVTALSEWVLHTNRRRNGAWTQRFEGGFPVTDLTPVPGDGSTGTTVHFRPAANLVTGPAIRAAELRRFAGALGPHFMVEIIDRRG